MSESSPSVSRNAFLRLFSTVADAFKIGASYLIGSAAILYCLHAAATKGEAFHLQLLLCILGGVVGWIIGLFLTPDSEGEKKRFGEAAKLITALVAGFGLGKADELLIWIKPILTTGSQELITLRVLLFTCCLLIAALFTYISRLHVRDPAEAMRIRREKLLIEAQECLDRLVRLN